ncbi:type II toxin-antitoxin system death-on-curing family toxin [Phytohabitans rumicis]|uniref:Toxin Doc n=1 Tax=Phytohabitans rumicis TaxID=1076125 RepID=A0A6V8KY29_9ACTN|nr:type II toxin-antitoxin system death-on-curing family toxin [Phytohabitans rumicis]GFJ88734.1 toxin Doc [Phytohabitans rumicis]
MIYLDLEDLLYVAERVLGGPAKVRDMGLLNSALARPQTVAFGVVAYPTLAEQAAALMHSICQNHALIDGNKRLALAGVIAFVGLNGYELRMTNDEAYELTMSVAAGGRDVPEIAAALQHAGIP